MYKLKISKTVANIFPAIASTLVMGIVGYFLEGVRSDVWWQLIAVLICIVVYFTALFMFPKTRREIFALPFVKKLFKIKNSSNKI